MSEKAGSSPEVSRLRQEAAVLGKSFARVVARLPRALAELGTLSPIAIVLALLALGAWWHEHAEHLQQSGELRQIKKQSEASVTQLQAQAAAAIREANQEHARHVVQLEIVREKLEGNAQSLRQRLLTLQGEERGKVDQVAALPTAEVVKRVATRLGLGADDLATQDADRKLGDKAGVADSGIGIREGSVLQANPESQTSSPSTTGASHFELSEAGVRKVEGALVELDNCGQQSTVRDSLIRNCQQQAVSTAALIDEQKVSLGKLNEALADKERILASREVEHKAELKIARGTFSQHAIRTLEHVAIGVAIGLVVRR